MNDEEGPKDKKPPAKNRPLERSSLINLNCGSKIYKESGSENDNVEEIEREKTAKNTKEIMNTKIGSYDSGEQAELQKLKNRRMIMKYLEIKEKMRKLLSPRK